MNMGVHTNPLLLWIDLTGPRVLYFGPHLAHSVPRVLQEIEHGFPHLTGPYGVKRAGAHRPYSAEYRSHPRLSHRIRRT